MKIIESILKRTVRIVFLATSIPIASYAAYLMAHNYSEVQVQATVDSSKLIKLIKLNKLDGGNVNQ